MKVRDIKPLNIEAVKASVVQKGRSQKSALNVFRVLDAILSQAVLWQLIVRNPCDAVQAPRPRRFIPHTPTPDELARLLQIAEETPYGPVARLAVLTGARQGELRALWWHQVDWEPMRLTIPGTKTKGSARLIDFGAATIALLRRQRASERAKALKLGDGATCGHDGATIFTNLVGRPVDAGGLKRTWKRIVKVAGVGHVRFHDLRHAAATYMLGGGVPLQVVSQRLGHTRTSTTSDVYAHVMPGMDRQAAEVIEAVMVNAWSKSNEA